GKSLDEVAAALRVSRRHLRGIEEGNYDGFPERVFSSGFIRAYAKYLSVDPVPVLTEYEKKVELRAESDALAQLAPEWLERERERGSRKTTYTVAAGVVLLLGILLAWFSMRTGERPPAPRPVAQAPVGAAPPAVPGATDNAAPAPRVQDNAAPAAAATGNSASPVPPQENAAAPPTVETAGGGGPLTGPFQLFLEANEHTWVMYSIDDGDPIDVTLYAGDKISIQAKRHISLKIGNAAGVIGTLNGQRLPPFGGRGEVRKLTFGQ
ncbi:MAG: RodZ domain-containing protein, partial [Verrucomicrobiota bacterium]